ncbi:MAG: phage virion morphogenesis protein [Alphaproteobacteria bacterium]|nr:phage virion morphogenesis protein [Alphaproteobacteria bacterium]
MSAAVLHIDATGLNGIAEKFERLQRRVADVSPLMDEIGSMLVASTQDRFERGVDPDGRPWTPSGRVNMSQGTAKTLLDSGRLMSSITHEPGNSQVEVGSNVIYAAIHQLGGQAGRGLAATIPARPYLGVSAEDEREIGNIVDDYLAEALQ